MHYVRIYLFIVFREIKSMRLLQNVSVRIVFAKCAVKRPSPVVVKERRRGPCEEGGAFPALRLLPEASGISQCLLELL